MQPWRPFMASPVFRGRVNRASAGSSGPSLAAWKRAFRDMNGYSHMTRPGAELQALPARGESIGCRSNQPLT